MRRAQAGEDDLLHKQFHHLQQDWNSYKQSVPRRHRRSSSSASTTTTMTAADADATATPAPAPEFLLLLYNSPKKLISSLQVSRTPSAQPRPIIAHGPADDTVSERKTAIKSGKLRGRSLLEALESAKDEAGQLGPHGREDICSICSSVLIQEAEAVDSSSCSCCSSSVDRYKRNRNVCSYICSSSNSSSSSYIEASLEDNKAVKDEEVVEVSERNEKKNIRSTDDDDDDDNNTSNNNNANGENWVVSVGWFALALVVLAFGLISYVEFGVEESVECMIPT